MFEDDCDELRNQNEEYEKYAGEADEKLLALLTVCEAGVADVGDQFVDFHVGGNDTRSLVLGWEKAVAPERGADDDLIRGAQHHIARQVVIQ